jgi:hypothetical protein
MRPKSVQYNAIISAPKVFKGLLLTMIIFCCYNIVAEENKLIVLPGKMSQIISPNGKWLLLNIDSEAGDSNPFLKGNHAIFLLKIGEKKLIKIYSYDRHAEVMWSPKGTKLFINDYAGSDYSFPIVILNNDGNRIINVGQELLKKEKNPNIADNHHAFLIATEWLTENSLKIKVYGYGEIAPDGFTLWYAYDIKSGVFRKLS